MSVDFRCENCGKLLTADATPGGSIKCPHCNKKATVPDALANLPRPQVPPSAGVAAAYANASAKAAPPAAPAGAPAAGPSDQEMEQPAESDPVMGVLAAAMPWVISVFFHAGLAMIMYFITLMAIQQGKMPKGVIIPDFVMSDNPGGKVSPPSKDKSQSKSQTNRVEKQEVKSNKINKAIGVVGAGGASAVGDSVFKGGGAGVTFAGSGGGNVHHVIWVIDRSGSMLPIFEDLQGEMEMSLQKLKEVQTFHIIFFAAKEPEEFSSRALVPADTEHKAAAAEFIASVRAIGETNPTKAITRAFEELGKADTSNGREGKLIYLLTDGDFRGVSNNNEVLELIKKLKKDVKNAQDVRVNTLLYGQQPSEARKIMEKIAEETGGRYHFVAPPQ